METIQADHALAWMSAVTRSDLDGDGFVTAGRGAQGCRHMNFRCVARAGCDDRPVAARRHRRSRSSARLTPRSWRSTPTRTARSVLPRRRKVRRRRVSGRPPRSNGLAANASVWHWRSRRRHQANCPRAGLRGRRRDAVSHRRYRPRRQCLAAGIDGLREPRQRQRRRGCGRSRADAPARAGRAGTEAAIAIDAERSACGMPASVRESQGGAARRL